MAVAAEEWNRCRLVWTFIGVGVVRVRRNEGLEDGTR
jgi:hypothetical protein